jgi:hypothetical protein
MPIKVHFEPGDPHKWNTSSPVTPVYGRRRPATVDGALRTRYQ